MQAGEWFSFDLDHSFTYDPTQTLIVGVTWGTSSSASFGTTGDPTSLPVAMGKKLFSDTPNATTGDATSAVWQHFGFRLGPLGLTAASPLDPRVDVFPNPATDAVTVTAPDLTAPATLLLTNVLGQPVRRYAATAAELRAGQPLSLRELPAGTYALTIEQAGRRTTRRLVVR